MHLYFTNLSFQNDPNSLIPYFSVVVRNFSQLLLFTFDSPELQVSLSKQIVVQFSKDGVTYPKENTLTFAMNAASTEELDPQKSWKDADIRTNNAARGPTIWRSRAWDGAAIVSLPLKGRLGSYARLDLEFSGAWILLSELEFISSEFILTV